MKEIHSLNLDQRGKILPDLLIKPRQPHHLLVNKHLVKAGLNLARSKNYIKKITDLPSTYKRQMNSQDAAVSKMSQTSLHMFPSTRFTDNLYLCISGRLGSWG